MMPRIHQWHKRSATLSLASTLFHSGVIDDEGFAQLIIDIYREYNTEELNTQLALLWLEGGRDEQD